MCAIWSGDVSFGLVTVPVKLYSATASHDVSLHQVHDDDGGRIRYQRRCEVCDRTIDYKHIDKAYVLRVRDDVIVLQGLRWADELRDPEFDVPQSKVSKKEQDMAASLVESYSEDFESERFTDEYQEQLQTLIEEKLESGEEIDTEATFGDVDEEDDGGDGNVVGLMEALKQSVDERRKKSSGSKGQKKSA